MVALARTLTEPLSLWSRLTRYNSHLISCFEKFLQEHKTAARSTTAAQIKLLLLLHDANLRKTEEFEADTEEGGKYYGHPSDLLLKGPL